MLPKNTFHKVEKLLTNYGFLSDCRIIQVLHFLGETFCSRCCFGRWSEKIQNSDFCRRFCLSAAQQYIFQYFAKSDVSSKIATIYFLSYFACNWYQLSHWYVNDSRKLSSERGVNLFSQTANHQCYGIVLLWFHSLEFFSLFAQLIDITSLL